MVTLIENLGNLHILGKAFDIDKGIIPAHSTLHNLDNGIIKG